MIRVFLHKSNIREKKPFVWTLTRSETGRRSKLSIEMPNYYNIIEPDVVYEEGLKIEGWSLEECYKRYKNYLESKTKNRLLTLNEQPRVYAVHNRNKVRRVKKKMKLKKRGSKRAG